jgi:FMN reductase
LRAIVHALRGWPTPLGVAINSIPAAPGEDVIGAPATQQQLGMMVGQQFDFLRR